MKNIFLFLFATIIALLTGSFIYVISIDTSIHWSAPVYVVAGCVIIAGTVCSALLFINFFENTLNLWDRKHLTLMK